MDQFIWNSDERNGIKKIISSCLKDKSILWRIKSRKKILHVKDAVKASEKILKINLLILEF